MIDNYSNNFNLFDSCLGLIDESFPGCKDFALNGMKYNACWNKVSTPFILKEKGEIIAHAGVWPITFMLNGKEHRSASIHGVCVKISHRGRGYFQQLMQEVMQYVENNFDSSVLFSMKPYLYKKYPYKVMLPEYDFILNEDNKLNASSYSKISDLKILQWDNSDDLNLIHKLLSNRVPLSNQLGLIHKSGNEIFILNMMNKKLYYSEKLNVLVVYEIIEKTLYLKEIISTNQTHISDVIRLILGSESTQVEKIIMQFCPDRFLDEKEYSPVLARPECCILTSDTFSFDGKYFRYPELYWC